MRAGLVLLVPMLMAVAVPIAAQEAPAGPDKLEQLIWQGAANANTIAAYNVYLRRYPTGMFADLARENLTKLGGTAGVTPPVAPASAPAPVPAAPAPAPLPASGAPIAALPTAEPPPPAAPTADASPLFLCRPVFAAGAAPLERASEAELAVYLEATRVNSLDLYRRYLDAYPSGVFAPEVRALIETRTARATTLAATPVPGPTPAHSRRPLGVNPDDYPPQALRAGEQGAATAMWEIGEDGCVQACRIDKSSGSASLDAATCRLITVRGRYDPARDSAGKPIRAIGTSTVTWAIPK